jgi:tRNA (guanosine-2'-O-)-methyltransferase
MDRYTEDLISHMSEFVTGERLELFHRVLGERTRYITVLLEDIFQSQNASAVLRTCDCTGIQDVYAVEERNEYEINPDVALGSDRWLTLHYYDKGKSNLAAAVADLKKKGYRIVATSPHTGGTTPEAFDLEKGKAALLFGTELNGLTQQALELADEFIQIPMVGFTESYNISVSAAVILYSLRKRLEESNIGWRIGEEERKPILLNWLRSSIKMGEQIEKKFRMFY